MAYNVSEHTFTDSKGREIKVMIQTFPARIGLKIQAQLLSTLTSSGIALYSLTKKSNKGIKDSVLNAIDDVRSLGKSDESLPSSDSNERIDIAAIAKLLAENFSEDKIVPLIVTLCSKTVVDGEQLTNVDKFDMVFAGEYGLLIDVIQQVLKENFDSFFKHAGIGKILSKMKKSDKKESVPEPEAK